MYPYPPSYDGLADWLTGWLACWLQEALIALIVGPVVTGRYNENGQLYQRDWQATGIDDIYVRFN